MKRIVVGVDESSHAERALRWAVRERDWHEGSVTAVLVWTFLEQYHDTPDGSFDPDYDETDAAAALRTIVERAVPDVAASVEQVVVNDLPARALLERSADADLLVVGARGVGRIRGALLGSVSQQCAMHSTVPVAIIRDGDDDDTTDRPERVLVGIDGSATSQRALEWAADEARARDAVLSVVHAWQPFVVPTVEALPLAAGVDVEAEGRRVVDEQLAAVSLDGLDGDRLETRIVLDSPAAAVLDAAADASLVVVGSRGRGGFASLLLGSVSQHVIQNAPCPVVVIPPDDKPRPDA